MVSSLVRAVAPIALLAATSAVGVTGSTTRVANAVITGTVSDSSTNRPLGNSQVLIRSTNLAVMTDMSGKYRLELPDSIAKRGSVTIDVRHIGYALASRMVKTDQAAVTADFRLMVLSIELQQVVVTGTASD